MSKSKFSKTPIIKNEIEKKAEEFINSSNLESDKKASSSWKLKKEKTKPVYLRVPESLWEDIHEVMARTGISMNAICLDLLRPAIKDKLKDLRE